MHRSGPERQGNPLGQAEQPESGNYRHPSSPADGQPNPSVLAADGERPRSERRCELELQPRRAVLVGANKNGCVQIPIKKRFRIDRPAASTS